MRLFLVTASVYAASGAWHKAPLAHVMTWSSCSTPYLSVAINKSLPYYQSQPGVQTALALVHPADEQKRLQRSALSASVHVCTPCAESGDHASKTHARLDSGRRANVACQCQERTCKTRRSKAASSMAAALVPGAPVGGLERRQGR